MPNDGWGPRLNALTTAAASYKGSEEALLLVDI